MNRRVQMVVSGEILGTRISEIHSTTTDSGHDK
jgi:hypothetical protein